MNTVNSWQSALIASWDRVWSSFLLVIPTFLGAVIVFSLGLILAFWSKRLVSEILKAVRLNKLAKSIGLNDYFGKAGIEKDLSEIVGGTFKWLIILVFFLTVLDILGLTVVSDVLVDILTYVPNIIAAALIFGVGYFVAGVVENIVRTAFVSVDHEIAGPISKFCRWLVIIITFFTSVDQLQIAKGLINTFFQGLTYTIVLAIGLSVGLGSKDLIARILEDWYEKVKSG